MQVAIVKQGFRRAIAVATVLGAVLAAAAPAAQAQWWGYRPFVRPYHVYHHPWGPRFYRPWRPVFFRPPPFRRVVVRPGFVPPPPPIRRVVVRPPAVAHRVVVVHAPPRIVQRTVVVHTPPRVVYHTRIVYRPVPIIHHPAVHHTHAIHYSYRNCGCQK